MKFVRNLFMWVVVLVIVAGIVGFFLPRTIAVERTVNVQRTPAEIYPVINSLRAFSRWSPWTVQDPKMTFSFEGADSGVGQKMSWVSQNESLGTGSIEIRDSLRDEKVVMNIAFGNSGDARSELSLKPAGEGTDVTWAFAYDTGFIPYMRYAGLIMPRMIGKEYETGLARLKNYVEAIPKVDFSNLSVSRVSLGPQTVLSTRVAAENNAAGMESALASGFGKVSQAMSAVGASAEGAPISIARGVEGDKSLIDAAIPVSGVPDGAQLPDGVSIAQLEEGDALRAVHTGAYTSLGSTYVKLLAYALTNGWLPHGASWNQYVSDPGEVAEKDLETDIYLPVK